MNSADSTKAGRRHRLLLDTLPHGVQENDCEGTITFSNRAHHEMLGYEPGELLGTKIWDLIWSVAERYALKEYLASLVAEQPPPVPYRTTSLRKDGSPIRLQIDWNYERESEGTLRGFVSVITDISDREAAHEEIRQRSDGLTTLLEVSRGLTATLDTTKILQATVDGVTNLVSLDTAAVYLLEDTVLYLGATTPPLPPEFPDELRIARLSDHPHIRDSISSGELVMVPDFPATVLTSAERSVAEQRKLRTVLIVPLIADAQTIGAFIVGSVEEPSPISEPDIDLARTLANLAALAMRNAQLFSAGQQHADQLEHSLAERIRAEEEREHLHAQLLHAQKMESIGRLAGGVAHDFNNMLGVILGHADLALGMLDTTHPLHGHLTEILNAAQRSATLTRQLLAFARRQTIDPKTLDLNETVADMLRMLRRLMGEDVDLAWLPGDSVGMVTMDPAQVDQILANLCVNARDAISGNGKVTIETSDASFDEDYCTAHPGFLPGDYVVLGVSDNGCGMGKETLAHIFEPFFSTKGPGEGTGLGLSMVYGIVKQNNGFIQVYSEGGQGTTFKIYLPGKDAGSGAVRSEELGRAVEGGNETILLVEDEPMILSLGTAMLETLGYHVLSVSAPAEAIRIAEEHSTPIDLLITDVVMPGMNGFELSIQLQGSFPKLKTLYMSGYTANVIAHHGILREGVLLLPKPFSRRELAFKVREAIAAEPST